MNKIYRLNLVFCIHSIDLIASVKVKFIKFWNRNNKNNKQTNETHSTQHTAHDNKDSPIDVAREQVNDTWNVNLEWLLMEPKVSKYTHAQHSHFNKQRSFTVFLYLLLFSNNNKRTIVRINIYKCKNINVNTVFSFHSPDRPITFYLKHTFIHFFFSTF